MFFLHRRLNNYKRTKLQYINNNFKTSLVAAPQPQELRTKIDIWLIPKLISECTPNSNFSANHEDNENNQDNENHRDNKN